VEENGKARQQIVQIGQRNGLMAEITSGLEENDKVIAHPDDKISNGTRVRARK